MCTRSQSSKECDSLVYGCLIRGLQNLNLYPKRVKASEVKSSVTAFANKLRSLDCFTYPQSNSNHSNSYLGYREYDDDEASHSDCSFTLAFAVQVNAIIDQKEALGVLEAHLTHVGEQKKK